MQLISLIEKINSLCGLVCKRVGLFLASRTDNKHSILYSLSLLSVTTAEEYTTMVIVIGGIVMLYFYVTLSPRVTSYFNHDLETEEFISRRFVLKLGSLLITPHIIVFGAAMVMYPFAINSLGRVILSIIIIQILIVLPVTKGLGRALKWKPYIYSYYFSEKGYNAWGSPIFFYHLMRGILYPLFFIGFLLLGSTTDMSWLFHLPPEALPITVYFLCYYPCYGLLFLQYARFRNSLWEDWAVTLEAANMSLIQFGFYFKATQRIHQISYLANEIIFLQYDVLGTTPWQRRISRSLKKFVDLTIVLPLMSLPLLITEIIVNRSIHYSLYCIVTLALLKSITWLIIAFNSSGWLTSISVSDYAHKNFTSPRIPNRFWQLVDPERQFVLVDVIGFCWPLDEAQLASMTKDRDEYFAKAKKHRPPTRDTQRYLPRVNKLFGTSILAEHSWSYPRVTGLKYNTIHKRHTHTTTSSLIQNTTKVITSTHFHKGVSHFHLPNAPLTGTALLNSGYKGSGWIHHFDQLTCKDCKNPAGYSLNGIKDNGDLVTIHGHIHVSNYAKFIDYLQLLHMRSLKECIHYKGATLYSDATSGLTRYKTQPTQDVIIKFDNIDTPVVLKSRTYDDPFNVQLPSSYFPAKGYTTGRYPNVTELIPRAHQAILGADLIGMDLKIPPYSHGANTITAIETLDQYRYMLDKPFREYWLKYGGAQYGGDRKVLNDFLEAMNEATTHKEAQIIWGNFARHFYPSQPPYVVQSLIPMDYFTPKGQAQWDASNSFYSRIDAALKQQNMPDTKYHTPLIDKAKTSPDILEAFRKFMENIDKI